MNRWKLTLIVLMPAVISVCSLEYVASQNGSSGRSSIFRTTSSLFRRQMEGYMVTEGVNRPVNFWGKIVDQNDQPIPGVKIVVGVRRWRMSFLTVSGKNKTNVLQSNADGLFSLKGARGDALSIDEIVHPNYRTLQGQRTFSYESGPYAHLPDSNNPVLFRMINRHLLETNLLKRIDFSWRIQTDGTPFVVEADSGVSNYGTNASGDIVFSFIRTPMEIQTGETQYDWRLEVTVRNGGLIATNADPWVMWQAPTNGFQTAHVVSATRDDPNSRKEVKFSFYYKLNDGPSFGRASVRLRTGYPGNSARMSIDGVLNPSGSRALMSP